MFPSLPDTFAKMMVYIGISLILLCGYFYIHNLDKSELIADELSDKKVEYIVASHEDSFYTDQTRKTLIDRKQLELYIKNPESDFKKIINEGDFRSYVYISLIRSRFNEDTMAVLLRDLAERGRNEADSMMKYDRLAKSLKVKIEGDERKLKIIGKKNRVFFIIGLAGLPLLILGLIRWHRIDSKVNSLLDVEIQLKKKELGGHTRK